MMFQFVKYLLFMALLLSQFACSPFYVMRAGYEQSKILLAREEIEDVVAKPETSSDEKGKLERVLSAREFAIKMGLTPKDSFTLYSKVDRDILAWVLLACEEDAFSLYTWWFPFVGTVPYKGYFDKEDAFCAGKRLANRGYEVWIRGTEAISTLGWFNDPVLSTTLRHGHIHIVNTVLHETLHTTLWVKNHVDFNESLANFVGFQGAVDYFQSKLSACSVDDNKCKEQNSKYLKEAIRLLDREIEISNILEELYSELDTLYSSNVTKDEKLNRREEVFSKHVKPLRNKHPKLKILTEVNNAELMQLKLYLTKLDRFQAAFKNSNNSWEIFLKRMHKIADTIDEDSEKNPFTLLEDSNGSTI